MFLKFHDWTTFIDNVRNKILTIRYSCCPITFPIPHNHKDYKQNKWPRYLHKIS